MCVGLTVGRYRIGVRDGVATLWDWDEPKIDIPVVELAKLFREGMQKHRAERRREDYIAACAAAGAEPPPPTCENERSGVTTW